MKILYYVHGTRGDIEPNAALAHGLATRDRWPPGIGGHEVRFIAPDEYSSLVPPSVEFIPHPVPAVPSAHATRRAQTPALNPARLRQPRQTRHGSRDSHGY